MNKSKTNKSLTILLFHNPGFINKNLSFSCVPHTTCN